MSAFEQILHHLENAESESLNSKLFDQTRVQLKDPSLYESTDVLNEFGSKVIKIVSSNNTSANWKSRSIELLDEILNHYSFDIVVQTFSLEMLIAGLQGQNEDLKVLIIEIVSRASPPDLVANTPFVTTMLTSLTKVDTSVKTVNAIEKALVQLAHGELVQRRLLSKECQELLDRIRNDPKVLSRCFDLSLQLLPIIHDLPSHLYLMSEQEFVNSNDVLLNAYIISFYNKLLDVVEVSNLPLWDKLDEQFGYICKLYVDDNFMANLKIFFTLEPVVILAHLSHSSKRKFLCLDQKYHIVKHAITHFDEPSIFLLANIDPALLSTQTEFLQSLPLTATTVPIFGNLSSNAHVFEKLGVSPSKVLNLSTTSFLELLKELSSHQHAVQQLIHWPTVMNRLLNEYTNITNPEIWKLKMTILQNLFNDDIDIWREKVQQEIKRMKGHTEAQVDVMDTTA
ncbi:hypothetical protein OGAPHI_001760 [Ogataea philodendri]|uniref:DNA mismatch repair protein HSM3 N-terminal domain-containing protein n=2 Tax=Ogataea TaxID=461281 RepID=A0A9P8PA70_9ASCO|nr:uncharacterized protein OGAPHI_001760 [Ogataea philodendri]KAH3668006.1 hypothetical protein OGAPHI_001760 [Ogataea philodendri]